MLRRGLVGGIKHVHLAALFVDHGPARDFPAAARHHGLMSGRSHLGVGLMQSRGDDHENFMLSLE